LGLCMVVDFVEGETLANLEHAGALPLEVKLRIAMDVLNGLSALHGHCDEAGEPLGLFHGAVSAASVLGGPAGGARLIHLALPLAWSHGPASLAPELKTLGRAVDTRADLYSVGIFLAEAMRSAGPEDAMWTSALSRTLATATEEDPDAR